MHAIQDEEFRVAKQDIMAGASLSEAKAGIASRHASRSTSPRSTSPRGSPRGPTDYSGPGGGGGGGTAGGGGGTGGGGGGTPSDCQRLGGGRSSTRATSTVNDRFPTSVSAFFGSIFPRTRPLALPARGWGRNAAGTAGTGCFAFFLVVVPIVVPVVVLLVIRCRRSVSRACSLPAEQQRAAARGHL